MAGMLDGQVALVTGAGQGMGRAIARRLAADGARVAVNDMSHDDRVEAVVAETGGLAAAGDVSDPGVVEGMVARVEEEAGPVAVLVANHARMTMAPFVEQDEQDFWDQVHANLSGTFYLVRAVLPGMRRRGGGRIVIIASEWGVTGWPNATAYAASKAGLISLTKTLGRELAPEGIILNAIPPGNTDNPQHEVDPRDAGVSREEIVERYAAEIPLRRVGRPEEIAATVAFLASPAAEACVGQILQPNGGTTRGPA